MTFPFCTNVLHWTMHLIGLTLLLVNQVWALVAIGVVSTEIFTNGLVVAVVIFELMGQRGNDGISSNATFTPLTMLYTVTTTRAGVKNPIPALKNAWKFHWPVINVPPQPCPSNFSPNLSSSVSHQAGKLTNYIFIAESYFPSIFHPTNHLSRRMKTVDMPLSET